METSPEPVRLSARLDDHLSRWLWLVKLLLALPHVVVLIALWIAFVVMTVVAFFAIRLDQGAEDPGVLEPLAAG